MANGIKWCKLSRECCLSQPEHINCCNTTMVASSVPGHDRGHRDFCVLVLKLIQVKLLLDSKTIHFSVMVAHVSLF
jgi:hypothetical protein